MRDRVGRAALVLAGCGLVGCGGGAPLLHPAHVLSPGFVSFGAGASGRFVPASTSNGGSVEETVRRVGMAPAVAPVVAARVGIAGSNEAGLTYAGRSTRVDARHAFRLDDLALSLGAGASVVLPSRPPGDPLSGDVYGGGLDVPLVLGWRSTGDLYAVWGGLRAGFEVLAGSVTEAGRSGTAFSARHVYGGGLLGLRAGFRHLHVAMELDVDYHHVSGSLGSTSGAIGGLALTPSGALVVSF